MPCPVNRTPLSALHTRLGTSVTAARLDMTVLTGGALPVSRFVGNPLDQIAGLALEQVADNAHCLQIHGS